MSEHPLEHAARRTFVAAREGVEAALDYIDATNSDDVPRMRLAAGGIACACDALKSAANAYCTTLGNLTRNARSKESA